MDLTIAVHFVAEQESNSVQISRRQLRNAHNVLELTTQEFVANFRITKEIFSLLLRETQSASNPRFRSTSIREDIKLATFLRFLATGCYQQTVGNEIVSSTSKPTVCRIITEYLNLFEEVICGNWIKMTDTASTKQAFYESYGFPGIIGCVDGTHIRIKSPGDNLKHLYYNRKGFYSINAMVVCDHKTNILYVDARHPGANHDAFVFEQSTVSQKLKEDYENGQRNTWVLGDSGYKLSPYLMTPFRSPSTVNERRFNEKHIRARNVVERCFGVLKNRFRCIIGSRGLHYDPPKCTQIINAFCALHNMCIFYKCAEPEILLEAERHDDVIEAEEDVGANDIRRHIALNI